MSKKRDLRPSRKPPESPLGPPELCELAELILALGPSGDALSLAAMVGSGAAVFAASCTMVTIAKAARLLSVGQRTLEKEIHAGRLPVVALGRRVRRVRVLDLAIYSTRHVNRGHEERGE